MLGLKKVKEDCYAMSDHFYNAFCVGELCSRRVSIKLLPYYTFFRKYTRRRYEISTAQSTKGNRAIWTGIERQVLGHFHSIDLGCYCKGKNRFLGENKFRPVRAP